MTIATIAGLGGLSGTELLIFLSGLILLLSGKKILELVEHLAEGINNFRGGGPGTPSHPLPANDSAILTRRRLNKDAEQIRR